MPEDEAANGDIKKLFFVDFLTGTSFVAFVALVISPVSIFKKSVI